jgi:hypothetical protein
MISEEEFDVAADVSPELAFVRLERKFRAAYEANLSTSDSSGSYNHYTLEYMNHVVAASRALGLDMFDFWSAPSENRLYEEYQEFRHQVDSFTIEIQIKHVRYGPNNSVALDASEKTHLRSYADAIKNIIDKSSLLTAKKERLFDRINAFIAELDKDRTLLQKFNDVILSLANTGGKAAEELEPAWKWVKLGAEILGVRQETEQRKLPSPPKRLSPPKRQAVPTQKKGGEFGRTDEEIPF